VSPEDAIVDAIEIRTGLFVLSNLFLHDSLFLWSLPKYLASYTDICRTHLDRHLEIIAHAHTQFDISQLGYLFQQPLLYRNQSLSKLAKAIVTLNTSKSGFICSSIAE
jgi:hypothetical protein